MARLSSKADLSIAEIVFYAPALILATSILVRHGFNRRLGWLYLMILSVVRLIGASTALYIEVHHDSNISLYKTTAITSSIGIAPLFLAIIGFLGRVNDAIPSPKNKMNNNIFYAYHIATIAAVVLAIVGGTQQFGGPDSTSFDTGTKIREAASILFLALYLWCVALEGFFLTRIHGIDAAEKKLVYGGVVALPCVFVRVVFAILSAFLYNNASSTFYFQKPNIYAQAFMMFLMEAVVIATYIIVGLSTPRKQPVAYHSVAANKSDSARDIGA